MNYTRKKHVITDADGKSASHKSINEAKRMSRQLQKDGHTVKVIQ